jgi:flagellar L-ring protein precursor FlgH
VLVIEARRTIQRDKETTTVVLAGECRREDVTAQNTVLSSQLADLTLRSINEGDTKDTASKGWITQLFEAVFNF